MTSTDGGPSWDERSSDAPPRPSFHTSLPEHTPLPRPRQVPIAFGLVVVATIAFVLATALAALDLSALREGLAADLPEDVTEDYTDAQVRRAVWALLGALVGLGALLSLVQLLSMRGASMSRRHASRTTFLMTLVLYLPVAVLMPAVRRGGIVDDVLTVVDVLCLLVAAALITRPSVSAWLRQTDRTGRRPLVPVLPGDESTPAAAGRISIQDRRHEPAPDAARPAHLDAGDEPLSIEAGEPRGEAPPTAESESDGPRLTRD